MTATMGRKHDIVIIGAGIVGTSIACHLAMMGRPHVAVIDKAEAPGLGSTAKAAGGIRAQFSSDINIELSKLSLDRFERFPKEIGVDVPFTQAGYLWIATRPEEMNVFERNAERQRRHGLAIELLDRAGVAAKAPYARTDDVLGGVFHARDGYASPADYVMGYHKKAKDLGVTFYFDHEVTGRRGRAVLTTSGEIEGDRVILAAGAWTGRLGEILGFDIPIRPVRRQCFTTEPFPELPHPIPMTVDYTSGVYLHSESGGVLVGKADKDEPAGFNETADFGFVERVAELATRRVPALERATVRTSWAGLYEVTPDHHPLIGEIAEGYWIAAGFSGHGVMHAPATGMLVAELLVTGRSSLDISSLRLSRFKEGQPIVETNVI
jgi:sarcosine oxidase, subunit beta